VVPIAPNAPPSGKLLNAVNAVPFSVPPTEPVKAATMMMSAADPFAMVTPKLLPVRAATRSIFATPTSSQLRPPTMTRNRNKLLRYRMSDTVLQMCALHTVCTRSV
jgi:hypothetical protein